MTAAHVVNVSGGKDSTATYLLALERGRPFRAVMADTGNEAPETVDYAHNLSARTGGPAVEVVRADFSERLARKREVVITKWIADGIPPEIVEQALSVLHPTGNPFVDLCLWKGRFPSRLAQFCTEHLKSEAIAGFLDPLRQGSAVVQWLGVRRDESPNRRTSALFHRVKSPGLHDLLYYRPLVDWTAEDVFALHRKHGLAPNPLYLRGFRRVGCFPCINASKDEVHRIAKHHLWALERLEVWEGLVRLAAKRGAATFFAPDMTPEGAALAKEVKARSYRLARIEFPEEDPETSLKFRAARARIASEISATMPWPRAQDVADWARTDRGGRQYNLLEFMFDDEGASCSSHYGLCE